MNILVVCHYGLYQNLTLSFVHNQLREFVAMGHKVRVIVPVAAGKTFEGGRFFPMMQVQETDGAQIYYLRYLSVSNLGKRWFNSFSGICALAIHLGTILKDFRPQVIHAHTLGFDSEIGAWLKKKLRCPLVVTTHGSDTNIPLDRGEYDWLRRRCERADVVVAVSSVLERRLATCSPRVPLQTILDGFILRPLPESHERDPYGIIQVCNLVPSKRVDMTVRALALLKEQYPGVSLKVVGSGSLLEPLRSLAEDLGVADRVEFLGRLDNHVVFGHLCGASVFAMVSKPEGFGIAYLEAMGAGCVAIGAEGQGIADVIVHGENGFLVPVDDPGAIASAIDSCFRAPEWARRIAASGRKTAEGLTWSENARQYLALFDSLINS